jgi:hypothetical protein
VEQDVEFAQGEGAAGLAEEGGADGAEGAADEVGGVVGDGGEGFFVGDGASAAAAGAVDAGAEFVVDVFDALEVLAAFGGEVEDVLVEVADAASEGVFFGEQAVVAGVAVFAGLDSEGDEVSSVHVGDRRVRQARFGVAGRAVRFAAGGVGVAGEGGVAGDGRAARSGRVGGRGGLVGSDGLRRIVGSGPVGAGGRLAGVRATGSGIGRGFIGHGERLTSRMVHVKALFVRGRRPRPPSCHRGETTRSHMVHRIDIESLVYEPKTGFGGRRVCL